ncbi:MAG: hypothetical protein N2572_03845 [Syntrophales bacterium]|nr:hypothetical protein [Syntrophales bacterium]
MNSSLPFWRVRFLTIRNQLFSQERRHQGVKIACGGSLGVIFWLVIFFVFYRVLTYFQRVDVLGDMLAMKLLHMIIVTSFFVLVLSHLIVGLSKLYLARDLNLVYVLPLPAREVFRTRIWEVAFDASWMVLLFGFPVFLSYGLVYKANLLFYFLSLCAMIALCLVASGLSAVLILLAGAFIPAGRLKVGLSLITVLVVVFVVVAVRLLRPEQLVNPEQFSQVAHYLSSLKVSSSPILPTTWVYDAVRLALGKAGFFSALHNLALAFTGAGTLYYLGSYLAEKYLTRGFTLAETVHTRALGGKRAYWRRRWPIISGDIEAFVTKEWKTFFRDPSQWPQLFLIIVLIGIYLYNFSVLPLDKSPIQTVYLQNVFSFLNVGLTAFVLTAIAARFVYPAVSLEGKAFWIVLSAPTRVGRFLMIKFFFYLIPLLFLSEGLIISTNLLLGVEPLMMVISAGTMLLIVPMVTALALAFGIAFPFFHNENPMEVVTSFGGILYMIVSTLLVVIVILLEAGPVYHLFMAQMRGESMSVLQILWSCTSLIIIVFLSISTVVISMREGKRRITSMN